MIEMDDEIESAAQPVRADTEKIVDANPDAGAPAVDPDREAARKIFADIKAARERAAKRHV